MFGRLATTALAELKGNAGGENRRPPASGRVAGDEVVEEKADIESDVDTDAAAPDTATPVAIPDTAGSINVAADGSIRITKRVVVSAPSPAPTMPEDDSSAAQQEAVAAETAYTTPTAEPIRALGPEVELVQLHGVKVQLMGSKGVAISVSDWDLKQLLRKYCAPAVPADTVIERKVSDCIVAKLYFDAASQATQLMNKIGNSRIMLGGVSVSMTAAPSEEHASGLLSHPWVSKLVPDATPSTAAILAAFATAAPGERPDTLILRCLPTNWFGVDLSSKISNILSQSSKLHQSFSQFGPVTNIAIFPSATTPAAPTQAKPAPKGTSDLLDLGRDFGLDLSTATLNFDAFVQFEHYASFVKAIHDLHGKMLRRKGAIMHFELSYDKSEYFSEQSFLNRRQEAQRLKHEEALRAERKKQELVEMKVNISRIKDEIAGLSSKVATLVKQVEDADVADDPAIQTVLQGCEEAVAKCAAAQDRPINTLDEATQARDQLQAAAKSFQSAVRSADSRISKHVQKVYLQRNASALKKLSIRKVREAATAAGGVAAELELSRWSVAASKRKALFKHDVEPQPSTDLVVDVDSDSDGASVLSDTADSSEWVTQSVFDRMSGQLAAAEKLHADLAAQDQSQPIDFTELKGVVNRLFDRLDLEEDLVNLSIRLRDVAVKMAKLPGSCAPANVEESPVFRDAMLKLAAARARTSISGSIADQVAEAVKLCEAWATSWKQLNLVQDAVSEAVASCETAQVLDTTSWKHAVDGLAAQVADAKHAGDSAYITSFIELTAGLHANLESIEGRTSTWIRLTSVATSVSRAVEGLVVPEHKESEANPLIPAIHAARIAALQKALSLLQDCTTLWHGQPLATIQSRANAVEKSCVRAVHQYESVASALVSICTDLAKFRHQMQDADADIQPQVDRYEKLGSLAADVELPSIQPRVEHCHEALKTLSARVSECEVRVTDICTRLKRLEVVDSDLSSARSLTSGVRGLLDRVHAALDDLVHFVDKHKQAAMDACNARIARLAREQEERKAAAELKRKREVSGSPHAAKRGRSGSNASQGSSRSASPEATGPIQDFERCYIVGADYVADVYLPVTGASRPRLKSVIGTVMSQKKEEDLRAQVLAALKSLKPN